MTLLHTFLAWEHHRIVTFRICWVQRRFKLFPWPSDKFIFFSLLLSSQFDWKLSYRERIICPLRCQWSLLLLGHCTWELILQKPLLYSRSSGIFLHLRWFWNRQNHLRQPDTMSLLYHLLGWQLHRLLYQFTPWHLQQFFHHYHQDSERGWTS